MHDKPSKHSLNLASTNERNQRQISEGSERKRSTYYRKIAQKESKVHQYMIILLSKISTLRSNLMFLILNGYLLSSLVFQLAIGYAKYAVQQNVAVDINQRLSVIDDATGSLTAALATLDNLDFNRIVYKGIAPQNLLQDYGIANLLDSNGQSESWLNHAMQSYLNQINMKMVDAYYISQEIKDIISNSPRVDREIYKDKEKQWVSQGLTFRELGYFLQPLINKYSARDQLAYMPLGISNNPNGDILEQTLRANLGGDESAEIYRMTKLTETYFNYIANVNKSFLLTAQLLAMVSITLIVLIILFYALLLRLKMQSVYADMFNFRVLYL